MWLTSILIFIILILLYICLNLWFKISKIQKIYNTDIMSYSKLLINLIAVFTAAAAKLERIDKNGSFSSDDEVGFAFKLIKETIFSLKDKLTLLKNTLDGEKENN